MTCSTITLGGTPVRVRDSGGDGIAVVMSSGIGQSLEFWEPQFDALSGGPRLIAWDYPNHGESGLTGRTETPASYADTLLALMDALGVERAVLVGNSLGGAVSLNACDTAPDRVLALLLDAPAMMGPGIFFPFRLMKLPGLGELLARPSEKGVEMQLAGVFDPSFQVPDALRSTVRRNVFKPGGSEAFLRSLRATLGLSGVRTDLWRAHREMLARVACPVVFVHGRGDKILPFQTSVDCAALTPHGEVTIFEHCGHAPQLEKPEEFNALLSGLISAVKPSAPLVLGGGGRA